MNVEQLFLDKATFDCPYCRHRFKESITALETKQRCIKCGTIFEISKIKILHVNTKIIKAGAKRMKAIPTYELDDGEHFCFPNKPNTVYKLKDVIDEAYYALLNSDNDETLTIDPETLVRIVK